jgi:hypothetical protein
MKKQIRRLRLREGDIVVVRDMESLRQLAGIKSMKGIPSCPILFAPNGVHRLNKKYLKNLLESI